MQSVYACAKIVLLNRDSIFHIFGLNYMMHKSCIKCTSQFTQACDTSYFCHRNCKIKEFKNLFITLVSFQQRILIRKYEDSRLIELTLVIDPIIRASCLDSQVYTVATSTVVMSRQISILFVPCGAWLIQLL